MEILFEEDYSSWQFLSPWPFASLKLAVFVMLILIVREYDKSHIKLKYESLAQIKEVRCKVVIKSY